MLTLAAFLMAAPLLGAAAYFLDKAVGKPVRIPFLEKRWPRRDEDAPPA